MRAFILTHLPDAALERELSSLEAQDYGTTASLLAHLAEIDARRLYLPAGYPSMYAYCVEARHYSDDVACSRIHAARVARQFPALYTALAEGRLHLTAVRQLEPHLTADNVDELIVAATHRSKAEIEGLLKRRLPPKGLEPIGALPEANIPLPSPVPERVVAEAGSPSGAPRQPEVLAPEEVTQLPERFALRVTIDKGTHDKLQYAQALLSHSLPSGDVSRVLDRALDALIQKLEGRKFGATQNPRPPRRRVNRHRHIPAHVRRAVWERDGGQCTFVSATGHRCRARKFLEFDHVDPVARGGEATVERMRLLCRGHNQFEAERVFGADVIHEKRENAQRARSKPLDTTRNDLMAGLRSLGISVSEARRAVEHSEATGGSTLEERMRAALAFLCPRTARMAPA